MILLNRNPILCELLYRPSSLGKSSSGLFHSLSLSRSFTLCRNFNQANSHHFLESNENPAPHSLQLKFRYFFSLRRARFLSRFSYTNALYTLYINTVERLSKCYILPRNHHKQIVFTFLLRKSRDALSIPLKHILFISSYRWLVSHWLCRRVRSSPFISSPSHAWCVFLLTSDRTRFRISYKHKRKIRITEFVDLSHRHNISCLLRLWHVILIVVLFDVVTSCRF